MFFLPLLADLTTEQHDLALEIFEKYGKYMYSEAYKILRNHHDAEDAVSETMLKIIKFISKFSENDGNEIRNKVVICIRSAICHKAIDYYNANKEKSENEIGLVFIPDDDDEFEIEVEDKAVNIEELVLTRETQDAVKRALLCLTQEQQDAINLVYYCGFSCVEAARFLGLTDNALRSRLYHARKN